jgi:4-diphosphocytidyl-2-C-methyl-D-erythritol kinase
VIRTNAFAKINLGLRILDRREDGLHNIETTYTTITLADKITLEQSAGGLEVLCAGLKVPPEENTCYRAAQEVLNRRGIKQGIKITVHKNIPVGGGLGGGSSDAAAVIVGLNRLLGLNMAEGELLSIARNIGCDVPFFIKGGAAYARGVGDELKFFKLPKMSLVVYFPGYPISTKWAYEEYDKRVLTSSVDLNIIEDKKKKQRVGFQLINDFEEVVFRSHPDLLDVKAHLLATGAFMVSLSGSGSCLFVVVEDETRKKTLKYLNSIGAMYFETETV